MLTQLGGWQLLTRWNLAVQLDAYRTSSLLLGFPESDLALVAAFASRTAATGFFSSTRRRGSYR